MVEIGTRDGHTWRWRGRVGERVFDLDTLAGQAPSREELQGDERRPTLSARFIDASSTFAEVVLYQPPFS